MKLPQSTLKWQLLGVVAILFSGLFSACKSAKVVSTNQASTKIPKTEKIVTLKIKSLQALDLEEELSFADEVVLTYTLTSVDENLKILKVINGTSNVEIMKKNQQNGEDKFKTIEISIPEKGKVLSSVIVMEIDDYQKAANTIKKINELGGIAKVPAMMLSVAEYQTPLALVFVSLQAAGLGIKAIERFDQDDLLGQSTFELKSEQITKQSTTFPVSLNFEGEHLKNKFHYQLSYELNIKQN